LSVSRLFPLRLDRRPLSLGAPPSNRFLPPLWSDTCRTFGSGVTVPFEGSPFYVHSSCRFTFLRFTHSRVDCDITVQRGGGGLLTLVEIIINKVKTVLADGHKKVSLPYDHTYQHIFRFGVYTRLKSSLLPLSVTWYDVPGGIDRLWVELDQELSSDLTGLCGKLDFGLTPLLRKFASNGKKKSFYIKKMSHREGLIKVCRRFFSETLECLTSRTPEFIRLCEQNAYGHEGDAGVPCAFFGEVGSWQLLIGFWVKICHENHIFWITRRA
uniref:Uncharacterized protein n=1 Tax=Kryptolebias marmoratus TaxID=37003 RepID=A0A3Q3AGQ0_KRYMA